MFVCSRTYHLQQQNQRFETSELQGWLSVNWSERTGFLPYHPAGLFVWGRAYSGYEAFLLWHPDPAICKWYKTAFQNLKERAQKSQLPRSFHIFMNLSFFFYFLKIQLDRHTVQWWITTSQQNLTWEEDNKTL